MIVSISAALQQYHLFLAIAAAPHIPVNIFNPKLQVAGTYFHLHCSECFSRSGFAHPIVDSTLHVYSSIQHCRYSAEARNIRKCDDIDAITPQVHDLGDRHVAAGYSYNLACKDAVCVLIAPPPHDKADRALNDLVNSSGKWLPPLTQLLAVSIGASHCNGFLRAVKGGMPTPHPRLQDENRRLNPEVLCVGRSGLKTAIDVGLNWKAFHWATQFVFPRFIGVAQACVF